MLRDNGKMILLWFSSSSVFLLLSAWCPIPVIETPSWTRVENANELYITSIFCLAFVTFLSAYLLDRRGKAVSFRVLKKNSLYNVIKKIRVRTGYCGSDVKFLAIIKEIQRNGKDTNLYEYVLVDLSDLPDIDEGCNFTKTGAKSIKIRNH